MIVQKKKSIGDIRRQHQDSSCLVPPNGQRRKSTNAPARVLPRPMPPSGGRTSSGSMLASTMNATINFYALEGQSSSPPRGGPAPSAPMLPVSPAVPGADDARPDEVVNLSQKLNELPSNLTSPAGPDDNTPSSPGHGTLRAPHQQARQPSSSPEPEYAVVSGPSQRQPAPSPEAFGHNNWCTPPQRAAAVTAQEKIKRCEASRIGYISSSQKEAEYFENAARKEDMRDRSDGLFVTSGVEDRRSDQRISEDKVVPESMPVDPLPSNSTLGRKRPSPEPEVSDGAKKQRAVSEFRMRAYDGLKTKATRQQRDDLIATLRKNWGLNWENAISQDLWLWDARKKTPAHPRDWSNNTLENIIQLSALTRKDPRRACAALREAISIRVGLGNDSSRLEKSEDVEMAKRIVSQDGPQIGRAPPATPSGMARVAPTSPQAGPATLAEVLQDSASSTVTLDHQTPTTSRVRRDSGPGGATISPTRSPLANASQAIKYENDDGPVSPRSTVYRRKMWTDDELLGLDFDQLWSVYEESVKRKDELKGELRRRNNRGPVIPSQAALSKLGSSVLMGMISDAVQQVSKSERALAAKAEDNPGGDETMPMVLDD